MSIEFFNESGFDGINEEMLLDVAGFALAAMDVSPDVEATITCVDEDTIAELHVHWMNLPGPTDVMSFPIDVVPRVCEEAGRCWWTQPGTRACTVNDALVLAFIGV